MEIYSPKRGDVTKFKLNVLKSGMDKDIEMQPAAEQKREPKIIFEKTQTKKQVTKAPTGNIINKAVDLCYGVMKKFFEPEEVL
jgi:hypothetical protein